MEHHIISGPLLGHAIRKGALMGTTLVFVYGTLLTGEANHHLIAHSRLLGCGRTEAAYDLMDWGPYPALAPDGRTSVKGEIYQVDDRTLAALDRLEGHPVHYVRTSITLADGTPVQAYVMERARTRGCAPIPSGDWKQRDAGS